MAKKDSATRGRKKAPGSRGGRAAGGGRKAAPKKTARGAARKTAAKKTAKKAPARKTAKKSTRAGAARKTTARRGAARGRQAAGRKTTAARGGTRARKSTGRRPSGGQVSRSTSRAKWIETPDDFSARPGETLATRNHDVIQRWAEDRGAVPATTPGGDPSDPRVLRFNFPGFGGENLQEVSWEEWFRTFDDRNLVFLFQDRMKAGNQSNFFRFDNPEREDA